MVPLLRASVFVASTLVSLAGHAEVRPHCITALEAQPLTDAPKTPTSPKKPCPVAITYQPDRAKREREARVEARVPAVARMAAPTDHPV